MSLRLDEAVPKWEIVQTSRRGSTAASTIDGVEFHDQRQPMIRTDEREIARLVVVAGAAVTFRTNGDPINRGHSDIKMATAGNLIGAVVFTERRAVGALIRGDFFGNKLNVDRDDVGVLFEFPYEQVGVLELEMKQKMFGGTKPVGIWLHARNPYGAGIRLDVQGELSIDGRSHPVADLVELFREIADAVALHSLPHVYAEARDLIDDYMENGPTTSDEGNPIVVFEREDETGPMPLVSISEVSSSDPDTEDPRSDGEPADLQSTDAEAASDELAPIERVVLAGFCGKCGSTFEGDAEFCSECGTQRQSKIVDS